MSTVELASLLQSTNLLGYTGSQGAIGPIGYTGSSGTGGSGGGATGGDGDQVFYENNSAITANYTISSGRNAMTVGPVTVANNVVITIPNGSRWVIL